MTVIYATTNDLVLAATRLPRVSCNNQNSVKLHVAFDASWSGYAKSAVFYTSKDHTVYEVILSTDGECLVPAEALIEEATLYIGVRGVKTASGEVKSSTLVKYKVLPGTPSMVMGDPSPSVYQQLLEQLIAERARLDNIIANGGTVEGDEVVDARVGYDGTTYANLYEAITGQVTPISKQVKVKNLIDFKRLTRGYLTVDGLINNYSNGFVRSHEVTSDYIKIDASNTYYFGHRFSPLSEALKEAIDVSGTPHWFGFCLYDADKVFIKRITYNTRECTLKGEVFEGATYVRVSYRTYMFNYPVFAVCSVPCDAMDEMQEENNLLDTYPMIFNGYVTNTSGAVIGTTHDINGYIPTEYNELTSDFIPCESGDAMFIFATASHDNFIRVAFYDANGAFVSSFAYSPTSTDNKGASDYDNILDTFVVPDGAVAMRISCRGAYITELVVAHNDQRRKSLYTECERKYLSKYETEKIEQLSGGALVKGVAHRGLSTDAPENTLSAYRLAKKRGFKYVECDVSFTSDGYAVLLHDGTVDRTSNGTGNIANLTLAAVRALDFGSWKSEKYAGEKIPTFEEFIALCKHLGLHPYIELKAGTEEQIRNLATTVKRYGMKGEVTWISFNPTYLGYIKAVDASARLGYVVDAVTANTINTVKQGLRSGYNEVFIDCNYGNAAAAVQLCVDADIPLEVWTVNSESAILALDAYVSGVTSDNLHAGNLFYENSKGG